MIAAALAGALLWTPTLKTTWQYQLISPPKIPADLQPGVEAYIVDLFETPLATVSELKRRGLKPVCYFSAGSFEKWRPDAMKFPKEVLGQELHGWPGERWLDIRNPRLRIIMQSRLDLCRAKGFVAADADNVDGYTQASGFKITPAEQLAYNRWLAGEAHARGLAIGLKNDVGQIKDLVSDFDFAVNEECFQYKECEKMRPFIKAGKPVFHIEYKSPLEKFCPTTKGLGFYSVKKSLKLDSKVEVCK
jgi:hypothetical protein